MVQRAVNGLIAKIIKEETEKAKAAVETRIPAELHGLVAEVIRDRRDYGAKWELNIVITLPPEPKQ